MKTFLKSTCWKQTFLAVLSISLLVPMLPADARVTFKAPEGLGVPGRRIAGGSRDTTKNCLSEQTMAALVPKSNIGQTTEANPVLYFYVPKTSVPVLQLVVLDGQKIYSKQTYKPNNKAGIVAIPLTKSLEVNKQYRWHLAMVCNPQARSKDKVVDGVIKRIQPSAQLAANLANATPRERVNLYAEAGIWHDTLKTLAELRISNPNDAGIKADWDSLLKTEGVNFDKEKEVEVINQPLLQGQEAPQPILSRI